MMGEHVRWINANPDSWAGPGIGKVIDTQDKRAFFGPKKRNLGPAALVKLDHNGLTVWCGPDELEQHEPTPAAA